MKLSEKILISGAFIVVVMLLLPPWIVTFRDGATRRMGYEFLWSPPSWSGNSVSLDWPILLVQVLAVSCIAGVAWFIQSRREKTPL
jgi:hypothetical protein